MRECVTDTSRGHAERATAAAVATETPAERPEPSVEENGTQPTIGQYHPRAGSRSAGGIAVYVQQTACELARRHPTYLYTSAGTPVDRLADSDATVVPIERSGTAEWLKATADDLLTGVPGYSPDVAESVTTVADAMRGGQLRDAGDTVDVLFSHRLVDSLLVSRVADVPVVHVFHGCQRAGVGGRAFDLLGDCAGTVANSEQTASELRNQLGHEVDAVVYPGVDTGAFSPDAALDGRSDGTVPRGVREALDGDDPVVTYVGRFAPEKGVFDLLDAFEMVADRAALLLVGRGDRERVRERISDRGLGTSVTVAGEVPHGDLPPYYADSDVVCLPTHYESFGMVNVEAMACGTAVLTTDLPGITEYATDGENARLVPPGDVRALAAALDELVSDRELRDRLAAAGRETATQFDWRATASSLAEVAALVTDE